MSDTENTAPQQYTEEDIRLCAEMLNSGVEPVAKHELDEVIKLINVISETLDKVYTNRSLDEGDFDNLRALWDQSWVVRNRYDLIVKDAQDLGLLAKITLGVRGFVALNKMFKAIKNARK